MSKTHVWKDVYLKPSLLNVDHSYQRTVTDAEIKKILDVWNYDLVRPPMVSQRIDGSYWIVDGQHTAAAWAVHENNDPIKCRVCKDLTHAEEVELFLQQFGVAKPVSTLNKVKAKYNRGDDAEVEMVNAVNAAGVEVDFSDSKRKNCTVAVVACLNGIKRLGSWRFSSALSILRDAWDGDTSGLGASFINGMVELYDVNEGQIDRSRLVSVLGKKNPRYFMRLADNYEGQTGKRYAAAFRNEYNKHCRTGKLFAEKA